MYRYIKTSTDYDYLSIDRFVGRALDIKQNQFAAWRTLADVKNDEDIQNLGEVTFGESYEEDPSYQEACRRVFEEMR